MYFATSCLLLTLLHYYSRLGTVRRLRFGFNEAKGTSKKLKQFSHQKIEVPGKRQDVTVPLDVESIEKDAQIAKEECSGQVVEFGNGLQQYLFERSNVVETAENDSEKGEETVLQMKDCMENAAQRRSRKGTPCRRTRDNINFTREKKENDEWSVTKGFVGRRSSPGNEGHDNCLNKRPAEHTKTDGMCSEPEGGFHIRQGGGQIKHGTLEKESDCEDITDDESKEDLTIPPPSRERTCQNGNCIQFATGTRKSLDKSNAMRPRCISQFHSLADLEKETTSDRKHDDSKLADRISRKHQFHGQELTSFNNSANENNASYHAEKEVPSSDHQGDMTASLAVHPTFLKERNMAERLRKGIPLYMPGRHKWINPEEGLQFYKRPSLVGFLTHDFELKLLKLKRSCNFSGTNPKRLFCDINVLFSLDHLCRSKWKFGKLTCFSVMAKRQ